MWHHERDSEILHVRYFHPMLLRTDCRCITEFTTLSSFLTIDITLSMSGVGYTCSILWFRIF
jgi:hypothetical protein